MATRTVLVIFGPKGVGKTTVARSLEQTLGIHHVDADPLILELIERGVEPDPTYGWLEPVQRAVQGALRRHVVVSVENLGVFPTDWEIVRRLDDGGVVVRTLRLNTSKEVAAQRVASRPERRVPVSASEQAWIYDQAAANDALHRFDLYIDTTHELDEQMVAAQVRRLLPPQ